MVNTFPAQSASFNAERINAAREFMCTYRTLPCLLLEMVITPFSKSTSFHCMPYCSERHIPVCRATSKLWHVLWAVTQNNGPQGALFVLVQS